jgi:uncharacterized LabA/DUF88 family protein
MTFNDLEIKIPFKANVFIDWLNVKMNGGDKLDFQKLIELITDKGGVVYRANIYLPVPTNSQVIFYDVMKKAGLKLIYSLEQDKLNCDTRMVVDIVTQSSEVDVVYLLSNDSDFIPAVEYLQAIGKRVLLIHGPNPSNKLRHAVDEWRRFEQLELLRE